MFFGEYNHQMDEKSRLRMPKEFKKKLGKSYMVTKGTNGCLFVFAEHNMKELFEDKLKETSLFDPSLQKPLRLLFSSAMEVEEDNQGRFLLTKSLREFAKLKKDVVFVGIGSHVEIWEAKSWEAYTSSEEEFEKQIEGLSQYGI